MSSGVAMEGPRLGATYSWNSICLRTSGVVFQAMSCLQPRATTLVLDLAFLRPAGRKRAASGFSWVNAIAKVLDLPGSFMGPISDSLIETCGAGTLMVRSGGENGLSGIHHLPGPKWLAPMFVLVN
jgi:hypothetical protein